MAIFFKVLVLNSRAKVKRSVVNQIRRMFRQIQHHEIKVQPHHTVQQTKIYRIGIVGMDNQKSKVKRLMNYLLRRKFKIT